MSEEWTTEEYQHYLRTGQLPARVRTPRPAPAPPRKVDGAEPRTRKTSTISVGEKRLYEDIQLAGLPEPIRELLFHDERAWAFDFAWPEYHVAVEVEGGTRIFGGGRHNRADGFEDDCTKYNEAQYYGWEVLRFTTEMVMQKRALPTIIKHLTQKGWKA